MNTTAPVSPTNVRKPSGSDSDSEGRLNGRSVESPALSNPGSPRASVVHDEEPIGQTILGRSQSQPNPVNLDECTTEDDSISGSENESVLELADFEEGEEFQAEGKGKSTPSSPVRPSTPVVGSDTDEELSAAKPSSDQEEEVKEEVKEETKEAAVSGPQVTPVVAEQKPRKTILSKLRALLPKVPVSIAVAIMSLIIAILLGLRAGEICGPKPLNSI